MLLGALAAALTLPAAASAATVVSDGGTATYTAAPGEANTFRLTYTGSTMRFDDSAPLVAGAGCTVFGPNGAECPRAGLKAVNVVLGDGDDTAAYAFEATGFGGPPPVAWSGGAGTDEISFRTLPHAVFASNDGVAFDSPNSFDNIGTDFEIVEGTQTGDVLSGSDHADTLIGLRGTDVFQGAAGDDLIDSRDPASGAEKGPQADKVNCGDGDDIADGDATDEFADDCELRAVDSVLELSNRADRFTAFRAGLTIRGHKGADNLKGSAGRDVLEGGPGKDKLSAGAGRDRILARDGERDTIRCGAGKDVVLADKKDRVASDCEKVSRR
jgi:Ca2+-binding RTX toxin-like protein